MFNFPNWIPDGYSHSPAVLDFFLYSGASINSAMVFSPLRNPDHVLVSVSIDFLSNSKRDALFHHIAYDYSYDDTVFVNIWEMLHGRISSNLVILLLLVNFLSGFRLVLMYISFIIDIRSSLIHLHLHAAVVAHRNHFCVYHQNKSSASKVKFRQSSNSCKMVPEAVKLTYTNKTKKLITSRKFRIKKLITSQKLRFQNFWWIANGVLSKGKSVIPLLFNDTEVFCSASDKAETFVKNFSKNSSFDNSDIFLHVFLPGTTLKLHNISVIPKLVKKVVTNLDHQRHLVLNEFQWLL